MIRRPPALSGYRLLTRCLQPFAPALLEARARRGKEDPERSGERLGRSDRVRPKGRLMWLHGVSVGESLALLPLVEKARMVRPDASVLVTTGTRTAAELMALRLPAGVIHQYAPVDTPRSVRAFLDRWSPDVGVFVESEVWPNMLIEAQARGVRLALVSATLSAGSLTNWRRAKESARAVFGTFQMILARDERQATALRALGARVDGEVDLKFGSPPLPVDAALVASLRAAWAGRPVIVAASTHPGEEAIILDAFRHVLTEQPETRLILAPRHPGRGEAVAQLGAARNLSVARRSRGSSPSAASVYVADTIGELGSWYVSAALAFLGGSLTPDVGGHNPMEPARLGCPILAGRNVANWPVYDDLIRCGGARRVSAETLADGLRMAWTAPEALAAMAAKAGKFVEAQDARVDEALQRIVAMIPA